jgi:hypothetical protein
MKSFGLIICLDSSAFVDFSPDIKDSGKRI